MIFCCLLRIRCASSGQRLGVSSDVVLEAHSSTQYQSFKAEVSWQVASMPRFTMRKIMQPSQMRLHYTRIREVSGWFETSDIILILLVKSDVVYFKSDLIS